MSEVRNVIDKLNGNLEFLHEKEKENDKNTQEYINASKELLKLRNDRPSTFDYDLEIEQINKDLIALIKKETCKCPDGRHCVCFKNLIKESSQKLENDLEVKMAEKAEQEIHLFSYQEKESYYINLIKNLENRCGEEMSAQIKKDILDTTNDIKRLSDGMISESEFSEIERSVEELSEKLSEVEKKLEEKEIDSRLIYGEDTMQILYDQETIIKKLDEKRTQIKGDAIMAKNRLEDINKAKKEAENYNKVIKNLNAEINVNKEKEEYYKYLKAALGPNGIKIMLLNKVIPILEERINENLSIFSNFSVSINTSKEALSSDGQVNGLFINIFNENNEEFDFSNYSGGQKMKISIAISEAIASMQQLGFRIYDETFIGLDDMTTENFSDIINVIRKNCPQIICISHIKNIRDSFSDQLLVENIKNNSVITYV